MKQLLTLIFSLMIGLGNQHAQGLFDSDSLLEIELKANWGLYSKDRAGDPPYRPASLKYEHAGQSYEIDVEIKARGRFRRDMCDIPPIKMKISKKEESPVFKGQRKIKMVLQCREDDPQTILKEYYVYKCYNLFTDKSFRVRLVRVHYKDSKGNHAYEKSQYAFFIESEKEMAARNEAEPLDESVHLTKHDVHRDQQTLVHVFNFMVANSDFGVDLRQNVKVITNPHGGKPIVVPYDFDYSGIVDAPYTKSRTDTKPSYFNRRTFQQLCRTSQELDQTLMHFEEVRPKLFSLYENSPYLTQEAKKETLKYYKNFFRVIKSSKKRKEVFMAGCN